MPSILKNFIDVSSRADSRRPVISWNLFDPALNSSHCSFAALPLKPPKRSDIERLRSNTRTMIKKRQLRTSSSNIDIQIRLVMIQFFLNVVGINQFGFLACDDIDFNPHSFWTCLTSSSPFNASRMEAVAHARNEIGSKTSISNLKACIVFVNRDDRAEVIFPELKTSSPSRSGIRMSSLLLKCVAPCSSTTLHSSNLTALEPMSIAAYRYNLIFTIYFMRKDAGSISLKYTSSQKYRTATKFLQLFVNLLWTISGKYYGVNYSILPESPMETNWLEIFNPAFLPWLRSVQTSVSHQLSQ